MQKGIDIDFDYGYRIGDRMHVSQQDTARLRDAFINTLTQGHREQGGGIS